MAERFRSYMGPGDKDLPRANEVQGYQPVSRIGEVVMNSFIDAYEHQVLKKINDADDEVPAFHEWATVQPGMICLARKKRTAQYRQFHAAETAMPVIGCAACLVPDAAKAVSETWCARNFGIDPFLFYANGKTAVRCGVGACPVSVQRRCGKKSLP